MKSPPLSAITPGLLGFLGMAVLGWHLASPIPNRDLTETETPEDTSPNPRRPSRTQRDGGLVAKQMRAIRDAGTPSERLRATVNLANTLPPAEFAAWVEGDRFDFRKGPELEVFRMILFERWIQEDPDSLIPWANRNNHGQAARALISLAENQPQKIIDHYRAHPNDQAELQILDKVAEKNPALALQRLQELSTRGLLRGTTRQARGLLKELAKASPESLESAMNTLAPDLQKEAESALSSQSLAVSFPTEIRALWQRPDGWRIFQDSASDNSELAEKLISEINNLPESWVSGIGENYYNFISEKNGRKWFDTDLEGAGFTASQVKRIKEYALSEMATSDPGFALQNLAISGVDSSIKQELITNAFRGAKPDDEKTARLIAMISSEEDRQLARDQLQVTELTATEGKPQQTAEWLEKLGGIDGAQVRPYEILNQLRSWDKAKLDELRTGFNGLPVDQQQNIARVVAAGGAYVQIDPGFAGDAIRSLVIHPPANTESRRDDPVMASSSYAVHLSMSNPAAATSWINTLPEGNAKLWANKNLAANWNQYDPKAVAQWMKTLPPDAREQVSKHLQKPR